MVQAHVVELANREAVREGRNLAKYEKPRAEYEFTEKNKRWSVFYEGKEKYPGNHFLVWVDDQSGKCQLIPGE
jgi:hypothetical protein